MKPIERVKKIIDYLEITISGFEKSTGLSNNSIQTAIKRNSNLKDETLNTILKKYPQIDVEWLLTGNGEMIKDSYRDVDYEDKEDIKADNMANTLNLHNRRRTPRTKQVAEPTPEYKRNVRDGKLREMELTIQNQQKEIRYLKEIVGLLKHDRGELYLSDEEYARIQSIEDEDLRMKMFDRYGERQLMLASKRSLKKLKVEESKDEDKNTKVDQ